MIWLLLLLLPHLAAAKVTGSSSMEASDFASCVQEAVLGSVEGECSGPAMGSDACIGLRKALVNAQKTECKKRQGQNNACVLWVYGGKTKDVWISVAAGHLAKFGSCLRERYGSEESNGLAAAQADDSLMHFLKKIDDGSSVFKMSQGDLLASAVRGDRFSEFIQNSPFGKETSDHELYLLKGAADNPEPFSPELASAEESASPQELKNFAYIAAEYVRENERAVEPQVFGVSPPMTAPKTAMARPALAMRSPASPENPYTLGLDRTIFERVRAAYRRNSPGMLNVDEFLRTNPPPPPRDLGELVKRRGTL